MFKCTLQNYMWIIISQCKSLNEFGQRWKCQKVKIVCQITENRKDFVIVSFDDISFKSWIMF